MDKNPGSELERYRSYIEKNFQPELNALKEKGKNAREFGAMFVSCFAVGQGDRPRAIQCVIDNTLSGIKTGKYTYENNENGQKSFGYRDDNGNHVPIVRDGEIAEILTSMGDAAHTVEKLRRQQRVDLAVMTLIDRLNREAGSAL